MIVVLRSSFGHVREVAVFPEQDIKLAEDRFFSLCNDYIPDFEYYNKDDKALVLKSGYDTHQNCRIQICRDA